MSIRLLAIGPCGMMMTFKLPVAAIVTAAGLASVSPGFASGYNTGAIVSLDKNSVLREETKAGAQKIEGSVSHDIGHATSGWNDSYSMSTSAKGLTITNNISGAFPNAAGHVVDEAVNLQAQVHDKLTISGNTPGQRLAWHRSMAISGDTSFHGNLGANINASNLAVYEFSIGSQSDVDMDPGPYLGLESGAATFATGLHEHSTLFRPKDFIRIPPSVLNYTMYVSVGQDTSFDMTINLLSHVAVNADASAVLNENFSVNFDTGPGFFTLVGNDGHDTGVRFDPRGDSNFKISSASGFNYLADAGEGGGGAVPEPASWALILGGFGATGGAMRMSRWRARNLA